MRQSVEQPNPSKDHLIRVLRFQAVALVLGVPAILASWVFAARSMSIDVVLASRAATLMAVPCLVVAIFAPLAFRASREVRERNYVILWFCIALFFNLAWEVPQLVWKSTFAAAKYDLENLPRFIAWWGYGTADLDYRRLTDFFVLAEISFWVANVLAVAGLVKLRRGDNFVGMILLGVCGALQVYNVFFFIAHGGIVQGFRNIAIDSWLAPALYWVMNLLWALAGGLASVFAFRSLHRSSSARTGASS